MDAKNKPSCTTEERCGCGKIYTTITRTKDNEIAGVLISFGKAGGCASATTQAIADLANEGLKFGVPVQNMVRILKGTSCPRSNLQSTPPVLSCVEVIAGILEDAASEKVTFVHRED